MQWVFLFILLLSFEGFSQSLEECKSDIKQISTQIQTLKDSLEVLTTRKKELNERIVFLEKVSDQPYFTTTRSYGEPYMMFEGNRIKLGKSQKVELLNYEDRKLVVIVNGKFGTMWPDHFPHDKVKIEEFIAFAKQRNKQRKIEEERERKIRAERLKLKFDSTKIALGDSGLFVVSVHKNFPINLNGRTIRYMEPLLVTKVVNENIWVKYLESGQIIPSTDYRLEISPELEAKIIEINNKRLKDKSDQKLARLTKKYGASNAKGIMTRSYWIGMTDEMARESLGHPEDINRSVYSWGTQEQWVYKDDYSTIYLYFKNGVLNSFQD